MSNLGQTDAGWALEAEALSFSYSGQPAVDDVSLTVKRGELLALVGKNGAGKSSLLAILAGILEPGRGRVSVLGASALRDRRRKIGYCPQAPLLWGDLTSLEQLTFMGEMYDLAHRAARARAGTLLEALGLTEKAGALAATLSGGMQRRLNLAMALVHQPALLILDEPTVSLDPESRQLVHTLLQALRERDGTGVILSTHDALEVERAADRVAVMDRGKIVAIGTPADLKARRPGLATIEVLLPDPSPELRQRAERALDGLTQHATWSDGIVRLEVPTIASHLSSVVAALEQAGITPREIWSRERSLEDAIALLTGGE